jgi:hypothetical protein
MEKGYFRVQALSDVDIIYAILHCCIPDFAC